MKGTLEIADTPVEGSRTKTTDKGNEVTTEDMLGHRRLQVETRLKLLAKWRTRSVTVTRYWNEL